MALGTAEYTPDAAIPSVTTEETPTKDQYRPPQQPALPTSEDWQNERLYSSLDFPNTFEASEEPHRQNPALETVDHTETINQLSELVRLQVVDTQIGQIMIQLELLEMIERLQTALIQQIPSKQDNA